MSCAVEGCTNAAHARGWCGKHYARWRRYGDPKKMARPTYGQGRRMSAQGYVLVWAPGHPEAMAYGYALEHRKVAHDTFGPIPPGHQVHHLNHDRTDNRPENLEVKPADEHAREHAAERGTITNQFGTWPIRAA